MRAWSVVFCAVFTTAGLGISYPNDLPSGPTIIVFAAGVYLAVAIAAHWRRKLAARRGAGDAPSSAA